MSTISLAPGSFQTFGDLLKYLRRREHLTQLELSISVGYSEAQISRLERSQRLPDLTALKARFIPALHLENESHITARFLELAQAARQEDAPVPGIAPYKGLLFFTREDADLFFGREALTAHLAERVTELARDASSRFLAIVGASGSGKSSLMHAGLAVALGRAGWEIHILTPTAFPMKALAANYNSMRAKNGRHHLIILDQFEEAFTLCRDENERSAYFERLLTIARDRSIKTTVVIALRADFYSHCAQYPLLREAVAAEQEYIGQMTTEELRRAIEEPAKRGGWEFEPGLVDVLLRDVGADGSEQPEPGALPLLSHALLATWERRRGRKFTLDEYHASGGVRGAIAETAESVFTDQLNHSQQQLARDIFLRLTELGEGTEDTRRRAALNELVRHSEEAAPLREVLNTLAEARLITLNEDSAEVAHEALIREWERLHEWLTQDREGLRLHRHLMDSAHEWGARGCDPAELYRGARLAQAREWASINEQRLNAGESAFLAASLEQEQHDILEREIQRQHELEAAQKLAQTQSRAAKQLRGRAIFLTGAFGLAIVLAGFALFLGNQANWNAMTAQKNAISAQQNAEQADANAKLAESEQKIATSRELAAAAIGNLDVDPERSILLALQAGSTAHTLEAENALHRSILASRVVLVLHHDAEVWSVAYSPDGRQIATASQDKTAKIWDASTGQLLLTLTGHTGSVNGVAFSPDGTRIATTSDDHTAIVWDSMTGVQLLHLSGHTDWVYRISFSPDGQLLATASNDQTARVWDAQTGEELLTLSGHGDTVFDVAFSPDGKRLATCGWDGNEGHVRVWDAVSGMELQTLPVEKSGGLRGIAFSPDGTRLAVTSNSFPGGKVWNAATGEVSLSGFPDHQDALLDITFSSDGKLIATGSMDNKAKVWDSMTGQVLYTLSGHTQPINGVAFNPGGTRLVTASWDHTARVWDITPAKELLFIPVDYPASQVVSSSPDEIRIITNYPEENAAKIWDADPGKELLTLRGLDSPVLTAAYSPDGRILAGTQDKTIVIWDAKSGEELHILSGHTDKVIRLAVSPDGTHLASASANGELVVWDMVVGKALFTLQGPTVGTSLLENMQLNYAILSLAYSPDGGHLISGDSDGFGIIWDALSGEKLFTISPEKAISGEADIPDGILDVAYSPDRKYLAFAGMRGVIRILDAFTRKEIMTLRGHTGGVLSVKFSPDGKRVATASIDGTVRVWDTANGMNLLTLPVGRNAAYVSFSPDGKRLAVGGLSDESTGIFVFVLPMDDLVTLAKSRVTRTLSIKECQQYLHMAACPTAH